MTGRPWLRYPATPTPRPDCPTRRYPNRDTATAALSNHPYGSNLTPTPCAHGRTGWHLTQPEPEPAGDCEPAWQPAPTLAMQRTADDVPTGEYL